MREERYIEIRKTEKVKDFGVPLKLGQDFPLEEREVVVSVTYLKLPNRCRCRKFITYYRADEAVASGKAMRTFKLLARGIVKDENQIWMPIVRERVPRVDLISRADIERAYIGSEKKSKHFKFNRITNRYEVVQAPEGITVMEWSMRAEEEVRFERKIRKQFKQYIADCHAVTMNARAALIVPFREDPFEGRTIFAFGPEQQTSGK